jgi:nucleoside 2-deoxyribosyltransferase
MGHNPLMIYFAGGLFHLKELLGNAALAAAISDVSEKRLQCVMPQSLEQRDTTPVSIRNQDLLELMRCDLGLFHFDGTELDSGTVVEFMVAKFLDIPAVIVRSDFRAAGDGGDPWNLMASFYPRTRNVICDSMAMFQKHLRASGISSLSVDAAAAANEACLSATRDLATMIVSAFDEVIAMPPVLHSAVREAVYQWVGKAVGGRFDEVLSPAALVELCKQKAQRGLL